MYLFVALTVLVVALGTSLASYFINVNQIDNYFKGLTLDTARNFASFVDGDYLEKLREVAESAEFQDLREEAELQEDEKIIHEYLQKKDLWKEYDIQRDMLHRYHENMKDVKYLYIVVWGDKNATKDMYLLDDYDEPIYETGYYETREEELFGLDGLTEVEPTISTGDWGWLCSGFAPVKNSKGEIVCQVGCDVGMDDVMSQRQTFFLYILLAVAVIVIVVIVLAVIFTKRYVINPLNGITRDMKRFKPVPNISPEEAGLIDLNIKSRDEIYDLYQGVWTMQMDILTNLNDIAMMQIGNEYTEAEAAATDSSVSLRSGILLKEFDFGEEVSVYAKVNPAKELRGDFYDCFAVDDDHVGLVMADVEGTGVPAVTFMMTLKTLIRAYTTPGVPPAKIMWVVNNKLLADNPAGLNATVWFGVLSKSAGQLSFANAGHVYPAIIRRDGMYKLLMSNSAPPLGVNENQEFMDQKTTMRPGDKLFLYTDGLTDAASVEGEYFGKERMLEILNENLTASPEELLSVMEGVIGDFVAGNEVYDDITMMSVVWNGKNEA